jgi:putative phosphoribosyl transferase
MVFRNRRHAGQALAEKLLPYRDREDVLVLALPRGGVPVAFEVARALHAPLDVFLVRKLGLPGHEELAMGAIARGGVTVINDNVVEQLGIPQRIMDEVVKQEEEELRRREAAYRDGRPPISVQGRVVILVDDGLATGASMRAAVRALHQQHPKQLIVAVPVGAPDTCREFEQEVDEVICAIAPERFGAVGLWYKDFSPTTDAEVRALLAEAARWHHRADSQSTASGPSSTK